MTMKKLLLAAAVTTLSSGLASAQDLAAGTTSFKKCLSCHEIGETAKNKVGPQLNGLDGRASGSASGYNFSDASKRSGLACNEATCVDYIKDPRAKILGTKMIFPGIKNETEAKNLWAHLKQFAADGKKK